MSRKLLLWVAIGASACTTALPPPPPPQPNASPQLTVVAPVSPLQHSSGVLPAYETAAERATKGQFDSYDDFRIANAQWYASTQPPKAGTFRAMAEWEPMQEVWTTYSAGIPSNKPVRRMYAEQTKAFASAGPVRVILPGNAEATDLTAALKGVGMTQAEIDSKIKYVVLPHNAIWHIDYGPFPIVDLQDGHQSFVDFVYYKNRHLDDAVPTRLAQDYFKNVTTYRMPFAFEGGNFQADGLGTCSTSYRALSNTGFSELTVRNILKRYLGCEKTIVMKDISDDGTGHIDMYFKWISADSVMIGEYQDSIEVDYDGDGKLDSIVNPDKIAEAINADFKVPYKQIWAENKARMNEMAALWANTTAPTGKKYTVYRLPMMTRFQDQYGDVPRTFINSTFFNGVNAFPTYTTKSCRNPMGSVCKADPECALGSHCAAGRCTQGETSQGCDELLACSSGQECKTDPIKVALEQKAYAVWKQALPSYNHVGVRSDTIALWSGAIHCITRTLPQKPMAKSIADGLCVQGTCGCSSGGTTKGCSDSAQCFGGSWVCDCNICKGSCPSGKACTDDADCSSDGKTVVAGTCKINAQQGCYGQAPSGGGSADPCGGVSFEGSCSGKTLNYCDAGLQSQNCDGCCGWDTANGYYNCLTGNACSTCVDECQAGQGGCSSQGTHTWICAKDGACNKRLYSVCAKGCNTATGKCNSSGGGGSMVDQCPGGSADAGSSDAGSSDAGSSVDSGALDTASGDAQAADSSCAASCQGKSCGLNGCGGSCGSCGKGFACTDEGQCVAIAGDAVSQDSASQDTGSSDAGVLEVSKPDSADQQDSAAQQDSASGEDTTAPEDGANVDSSARPLPDSAAPLADGVSSTGDVSGYPPGAYVTSGPSSGCSAGSQGHPAIVWLLAAVAAVWRRRRFAL